jgi:phage shock protein A
LIEAHLTVADKSIAENCALLGLEMHAERLAMLKRDDEIVDAAIAEMDEIKEEVRKGAAAMAARIEQLEEEKERLLHREKLLSSSQKVVEVNLVYSD